MITMIKRLAFDARKQDQVAKVEQRLNQVVGV
jgi:hypothetical protein